MLHSAERAASPHTEGIPVIPGSRLLVQMEARAPERNVLRAYEVSAGQDLFGDWFVQIRFGRIGKKGRRLDRIFFDETSARRQIGQALRRRASAKARIGVSYRVTRADGDWAGDLLSPAGPA